MVDLSKASPRPWFLDGDGNGNGEVWSEEDAILEPCGGVNKDEAQINAALIVAAVNAYSPEKEEAWKAALEKIAGLLTLEETGQSADLRMTVAALDSAIGIARNALAAKADGGAS